VVRAGARYTDTPLAITGRPSVSLVHDPGHGDAIRFQLFIGRYEEGIVRAILNTDAGTKLHVEYGSNSDDNA
jgi:hypothetical protein